MVDSSNAVDGVGVILGRSAIDVGATMAGEVCDTGTTGCTSDEGVYEAESDVGTSAAGVSSGFDRKLMIRETLIIRTNRVLITMEASTTGCTERATGAIKGVTLFFPIDGVFKLTVLSSNLGFT